MKSPGKGFGKTQSASEVNTPSSSISSPDTETSFGLTSIDQTASQSSTRPQLDLDPNLSTDERNKEILKQKFGLRSFEDQQTDIKKAEKMAENARRMDKVKQMKDEEVDLFMILPPPLLRAIDVFLKAGLVITTTLFISAGVGITAEAWSVATGNTLPQNVDDFIVNVIEPNFTLGLFVLLGFSVSLGIFATAQLGSGSSTYKEQ